jgi:threonine dehydratase
MFDNQGGSRRLAAGLDRDNPVSYEDVEEASGRVESHALRTPLTRSAALSRETGREIWLKQENLQHTGSFKPRGALSRIGLMGQEEKARGVVAASAGNHALGVAYACQVLAVREATVFVQSDASPAKLARLRDYPVEVHLISGTFEAAQQAALDRSRRSQAIYVSPYDDAATIAGQGTVGMEIAEQLADLDVVVVPVGGGALIAGIALSVKAARPGARVVGVNPEASPSALLSLREGRAIDPYQHAPTRAQGLAGGFGRIPFSAARHLIDEIVLVSEEEIADAMVALIDSDQLLAEPSGAAAVAAILSGKIRNLAGRVVAVVSGGNVDTETLREVLGRSSRWKRGHSQFPGNLRN